MEILIHSANIIYLLSYLMRDILWLRLFTIIAAVCLIFYFYFLPEPILTPVYWNVLFVSLNVFWVSRLLLERRPVQLNADEQQLCDLVFRLVSPREMINLLKIGKWQASSVDDCIARTGEQLDHLMLIHSGQICYIVNGKKTHIPVHPSQY